MFRFFDARAKAGDYDGALWRLRHIHFGLSRSGRLHHEALILMLAGRPAEAEPLLRDAIATTMCNSNHPRERLYSSLGHTLTSLGQYGEAEECFDKAIAAGDVTGNSQNGLAELRIEQGRPEEALVLARLAIDIAGSRRNGKVPAVYYVDQAWALALLSNSNEARESLDLAQRMGPGI